MVFQNTPNTEETPWEMNTYIPEMKALWMAEKHHLNPTQHLHAARRYRCAIRCAGRNTSARRSTVSAWTPRSCSPRWPRWAMSTSKKFSAASARYSMFHMNNQVLHLANQGVTINQIHNVYEVPKEACRRNGSAGVITAGHTTAVASFSAISDSGIAIRQLHSVVAKRFCTALRRDDGRRRQDPRPQPGAA